MSIKNLYLPAQSGKIRMENGVYCGLKGVKSMIEVIYKEETDTTKETAEYVKLPNNVRQIGEIKGKKKIYMEDYVYTFLKKIARNPHGDEVAAILFGSCHWTGQGFRDLIWKLPKKSVRHIWIILPAMTKCCF